jgi:hypothetical protein
MQLRACRAIPSPTPSAWLFKFQADGRSVGMKMLKVRSSDSDLRRRGRVLAIMLLGLEAALLVLSFLNLYHGDTQYIATNGFLVSLVLGLYLVNRFGFVRWPSVCCCTWRVWCWNHPRAPR